VVVRNTAPTHKRRHHRHIEDFRQLDQQIRGVGVDDAAAGDEQRPLGGHQHIDGLGGLSTGRRRLVHRQRLIGLGVEVDLG
jgi:hypothetical protein